MPRSYNGDSSDADYGVLVAKSKGFLGRNGESYFAKASAFTFPSWKTRESSRDVSHLAPVWADDKNMEPGAKVLTGENAILYKEKQKIREEDLSWDTYRHQSLVAFSLSAEAEQEKCRGSSQQPADHYPQHFAGLEFNACILGGKSIQ